MSVQEILKDLDEDVDRVIEEIHAHFKDKLNDEEAGQIVDAMQKLEDKLANLLAEYGVEIGDERID